MLNHEGLVQGVVCDEKHGILVSVVKYDNILLRDSAHLHGNTTLCRTADTDVVKPSETSNRQDSFNKNKYIHCVRKTVVQHNFGKP